MKFRGLLSVAALAAVLVLGTSAYGTIYINEVLGSTTGTDDEFIELYNSGPAAVDISGWSIELWDSDAGASYGFADGGSPYVIPALTSIAAGNYYLMANTTFSTHYAAPVDLVIQENAIENSSYTIILADAGASIVDSIFVVDSGISDTPNRNGVGIIPNASIGPDGTNLPAGFYRAGDGSSTLALLEFSPQPAPSATPGAMNLPEPGTLALLAMGGLMALRRR